MAGVFYKQPLDDVIVIAFRDPDVPYQDTDVVSELLECGYNSRPRNILVDLSAVCRLPSAIIGGLISLRSQLMRDSRRLVLLRVSPSLRNQLSHLDLEHVFDTRDSLLEGVRFLELCDAKNPPLQYGLSDDEASARYRYHPSV